MKYLSKHRKKIALTMLLLLLFNLLAPCTLYALTSGPAQPETKGFQPAGVSDMVDLQSGDLKYNIPLLDIDGYPINLNYQSGTSGIDDEASWVGLGWNLNVGAINRQVRGLPDDFAGDKLETDHWTKPKVTVGGTLNTKVEIFGHGAPRGLEPSDSHLTLSGSFTYGIFNDNYTGIGAQLGVNAGMTLMEGNDKGELAGLGFGVLSNTQSGVNVSPYISMPLGDKLKSNLVENSGLSAQLGYNTRSGMESFSMSTSFSSDAFSIDNINLSLNSTINYNTPPIWPRIQIPYSTTYSSYSLNVGPSAFFAFGSLGVTGYKNVRRVKSEQNINPGYGFLYAERGKNNPQAVMDFIRENDNPIIPAIPNLAVPVQMPDMFSFTSQSGSGQFRLYRGGSGVFFDNQESDQFDSHTLGGDIGFNLGSVHGGITYYKQSCTTHAQKWTVNNDYFARADFQDASTTYPNQQHVFFRTIGEKNIADQDMLNRINGTNPVEVEINGNHAGPYFRNQTNFYTSLIPVPIVKKGSRQPNKIQISYLTAQEAAVGALDKKILNYPLSDSATFVLPAQHQPLPQDSLLRFDAADATDYTQNPPEGQDPNTEPDHIQVRKPHHISEITVTGDDGKRMVYGIPVYNLQHDEYSFGVGTVGTYTSNKNNVNVSGSLAGGINHYNKGVDDYYHKETKPPYATSYLLTAILSPDYVDKTGDGISDDDLGTAIKFNYSKLNYAYKWRSPYTNATLNKGLLADPDDDKGSIIYGKKEVWYIHSIESKTKIVYFITKDRRDALGASDDWTQGGPDTTNKLKYLSEIRLYSKADMTKPIKVVKFQYNYQLCPGIPNSADLGTSNPSLGGKLTLTRVWFEFGNIHQGKYHPYVFTYNTMANGTTPGYDNMMTDRWGTYKPRSENIKALDNDEFPYASQNKTNANQYAALWQLSKIELPTGGIINVNYESDDYAYVQNRKAMVMSDIEALFYTDGSGNMHDLTDTLSATYLRDAQGVKVHIATNPPPGADATHWFKTNYLDGADYMYTKFYVNVSTTNSRSTANGGYDFIPCYAQVNKVVISGSDAYVSFLPLTDGKVTANPIIMAAWQRMKNEYPRYAYPGFDNRITGDQSSLMGVVTATANAAKNLTELRENFYQKAYHNKYATQVSMCKSFVRLTKNETGGVKTAKLGGGARVKSIRINDSWSAMGGTNAPSGAYGQAYDYSTTDNGQPISSGVATYEPSVGNDENPFKQPVMYTQSIKGGIDNYMEIDEPFGESLFPAPTVTYSKVAINDLGPDGLPDASLSTGSVVNEFYTLKDFPVKVNVLDIYPQHPQPHHYFSFVNTLSDDELILSQGYSIELNDMNGKAKAVRVLNQSGIEVSSTAYYYKATDNGGTYGLNNQVNVVARDGTISSKTIGQDVELFTDFREQESSNRGTAVNLGFDFQSFFIINLYVPHLPIGSNDDYKLFRSACALKVIQNYGIIDSVVKRENGSSVTTQNLAFDGLTGEALVTRTQNEFRNNIYSVKLPAYWVYPGMGGAYQNLGVLMSGFSTNTRGEVNNYANNLHEGDEIVDLTTGIHYWIVTNDADSKYTGYANGKLTFLVTDSKKLIDRYGNMIQSFTASGLVKVVRSGYRNQLADGAGTLVCLNNPIVNGQLQLALNTDITTLHAINASASTYDENWAVNRECIPAADTRNYSVENTNYCFYYGPDSYYWNSNTQNKLGSYLMLSATQPDFLLKSTFWGGLYNGSPCNYPSPVSVCPQCLTSTGRMGYCQSNTGPMARCGIERLDYMTYGMTGYDVCFNADPTKTYYIGFGTDLANMDIYIDGAHVVNYTRSGSGNPNAYLDNYWQILPLHLANTTSHTMRVEVFDPDLSGNHGIEIYQNTHSQLLSANDAGSGINVVFSTANLTNVPIQSFVYDFTDNTYTTSKMYYHYTTANGAEANLCSQGTQPPFVPSVLNPFIQGYLGNWRPYQSLVYQQSRNYNDIFNPLNNRMDIANAGYINGLYFYWYFNSITSYNGLFQWFYNPNATRWTLANTVTQYDKYGQQLENKDALGRFSAAKFDFNSELPAAVASNAMNREIYSSAFEDTKFSPGNAGNLPDTCSLRDFKQPSTGQSIQSMVTASLSHSGNYSVQLPSEGVTLSTLVHNHMQKTDNPLALDSKKQYITRNIIGLYPNGFEPSPGKKYIFNAWVKDAQPNRPSVPVNLSANNTNVALKCKAVVEGWKLVEGTIDLTLYSSGSLLNLSLTPNGSGVYIDDIRIHPFDAHLKTYAYDDRTMRLMAELDENCFATFYEYDSEGLLVRVKKETEKGVMTLKESRSSYKQRTN